MNRAIYVRKIKIDKYILKYILLLFGSSQNICFKLILLLFYILNLPPLNLVYTKQNKECIFFSILFLIIISFEASSWIPFFSQRIEMGRSPEEIVQDT